MLLWMEGFEGGGTTKTTMGAYLVRKYADHSVASWAFSRTGRYGGKALEILGTEYFKISIDNKQTFIIGFAFKCEEYVNNEDLLILQDSGTTQMRISTRAGGDLRVERGTTTLDTTIGLGLAADASHYIDPEDNIAAAV